VERHRHFHQNENIHASSRNDPDEPMIEYRMSNLQEDRPMDCFPPSLRSPKAPAVASNANQEIFQL